MNGRGRPRRRRRDAPAPPSASLAPQSSRASADVKTVMNRQKLKPAESGSVLFNFDKLGQITVVSDKDEDGMMEVALEAGAEDLEAFENDEEKGWYVLTQPTDLAAVSDAPPRAGRQSWPRLLALLQAFHEVHRVARRQVRVLRVDLLGAAPPWIAHQVHVGSVHGH